MLVVMFVGGGNKREMFTPITFSSLKRGGWEKRVAGKSVVWWDRESRARALLNTKHQTLNAKISRDATHNPWR